MKTLTLTLASILLFVPLVAHGNSEGFGSLTPAEVAARLKEKNVYVFDNNELERWQKSHVPGARWVHPTEYEAKELPADKSATLIFYCANPH